MSLLEDLSPAFGEIKEAVKAAAAPLHAEIERLKNLAAAAEAKAEELVSELQSKSAEVEQLKAGFEQFKAELVAAVSPAPVEQPAHDPESAPAA